MIHLHYKKQKIKKIITVSLSPTFCLLISEIAKMIPSILAALIGVEFFYLKIPILTVFKLK